MTTFVDTSALFALLDEDDTNHAAAVDAFRGLNGQELVTHAYVIVETLALVARRLGWEAVDRLAGAILPVINTAPVDGGLHDTAMAAYLEAASGRVSFVDRTSFAFMRSSAVDVAFAYDVDFTAAGFVLVG